MATYTRADLVRSVLSELGVIDGAEAPEAEDYALTDARCQQELERLHEDGMVTFDVDGLIPARYFALLVPLIASTLINAYGVMARREGIKEDAREALRGLARLRQKPDLGSVTQATYY
ncbi:hypothetical protein [Coralloluteibacterium thermophilus]|uniref:Uncharacterized protein n=1 Tax=Coralloluteibacterium thermophilum TaxID=2707049 RepID=A0ABV9NPN2_9GAMM